MVLIASVPLFSVLYMLITRGGARLGTALFTQLPPTGFMPGGGFGNAILGTVVMVAIASLISIPFGVLAATYLSYLQPNNRLTATARFLSKVLTGFPSILAGVLRLRDSRAAGWAPTRRWPVASLSPCSCCPPSS